MTEPYVGPERRAHTENEALVCAIRETVREEIRPLTISQEAHAEHHQFITELIEERRERRERAEKIKAQVGGWAVIAVLTGIGSSVWQMVKTTIEHHPK